MGRLFLVEYDRTPQVHFFVCRTCQTHIALTEEFCCNLPLEGLPGVHFRLIVNVFKDGPEKDRQEGTETVSDVYCNKCSNRLGIQEIKIDDESGVRKEEYFLLHLAKLQMWNGNQIVDANTEGLQ